MPIHRPMSYRLFFVLILMLTVGLTGCSFKSNEYTPVLTSINISPSSARLAFGEEQQFTAVAKDQKGKTMSGITFQWAVVPEDIGEITSDGLFTAGNKKGSCDVICTVEGKTATVKVTVYNPEEEPPGGPLEAIAEQIVDDTRRVGGTIEFIIQNKLALIQESLEEQFLPYLPSVAMAVEYNISGIASIMDSGLFWYQPGEYTLDVLESGSAVPGEKPQSGTWILTWVDEWYYEEQTEQMVTWTSTISRESDGTTDTITYTNTNDFDQELNYGLVLTFPTALWGPWDEEEPPLELEGDLLITMKDSYLDPSIIRGKLLLSETEMGAVIDGEVDFRFKSGDFIKFNGELSVQLDEKHEDYFTGTLETADFKVTGDIWASYAENLNMPQEYGGVFPKSLSVDGEIRTKDKDPVILNGAFLLEIRNAATFNPNFEEEEYSADNWLNGKVTFNGLIRGSKKHSVEGELILEETAFNEYELDLTYTLDDNGVVREITILVDNEGNSLEVEINSTWGPARIWMEATFDDGFGNAPTSLGGTVEIEGVKVGKISLTQEGVRVDYTDDTFETF